MADATRPSGIFTEKMKDLGDGTHAPVVALPPGGSGLTDSELRATAVPVSGPLTDAQLRAAAVPISGSVAATGPLTDTQLRAVAVPVSGPLTDGQLRATAVPVSGPLTDSQLRATPVPVSGTVTANAGTGPWPVTDNGGSLTVDGTFWQTTQPVSGTVTANQGTSPWVTREQPAAMTWVSAKTAAPAANAVQVDTGALAAGDYDFDINLMCSDTVAVGKGLVVEHRNAANNATLQNLGGVAPTQGGPIQLRRYTIATNERIRVIAGTAAGLASSMYVSAIGRRLS